MGKTSVKVPSWKDRFPLATTIYTPPGYRYDSEEVVVLINGALGVNQISYSKFAMFPPIVVSANGSWLTKQNLTAVTYDYRYTVFLPFSRTDCRAIRCLPKSRFPHQRKHG